MATYSYVCSVCSQTKRVLRPVNESEKESKRCKSCIKYNKHKEMRQNLIAKEESSIFVMNKTTIKSDIKSKMDYIFNSNNISAKQLHFKPLINNKSFYSVTNYSNKYLCSLIVFGYLRRNNCIYNELVLLIIKYYCNTELYTECCIINKRNDSFATPLLFEIINLNLKKENYPFIMICFKVNNVLSNFKSNLNRWHQDRENHSMQLNILEMSADKINIFKTCYLNFIQNTNSLLSLKRLSKKKWYQHKMIKHNKQKINVNSDDSTKLCGSSFLLKNIVYLGNEKIIKHELDINDTFCMIINPKTSQNNINYYIIRRNDNKLYPICSSKRFTNWGYDNHDHSCEYFYFYYIEKIQKVWQRDYNLFWKNNEFFPIISTISGIEFKVTMYGLTKTELDQIIVPFEAFERVLKFEKCNIRMHIDEWNEQHGGNKRYNQLTNYFKG